MGAAVVLVHCLELMGTICMSSAVSDWRGDVGLHGFNKLTEVMMDEEMGR